MIHEKIIKREDGKQYRISVNVYLSGYSYEQKIGYGISVEYREKGKRKWLSLPDNLNEWKFRKLSMEGRRNHKIKNTLNYVTEDEVYQAKLEAWEKLKPTR